jgi:hypothetical protein
LRHPHSSGKWCHATDLGRVLALAGRAVGEHGLALHVKHRVHHGRRSLRRKARPTPGRRRMRRPRRGRPRTPGGVA